ncbi:transcription antitermination factor NusB [Sporolactobacillus pectinivorans]|uniref:transcription antitermination factor NusB n=1 Tax=Sporolactobacillus pectinivorans TaxID=1591408 RepID=UPI000C25AEEA|nr:transcription antitermination factor NusB [Sporolactobacillus pectinivorans]
MNRRQAREIALQVLFQTTLSNTDRKIAIDAVNGEGVPVDPFVVRLLNEISSHETEIDRQIKAHLVNWSFDRIGNIDKTILRLAICEMLYFDDIPTTVSINEAVELCRKYGDEQTRKFVNGILSSISKEIETKNR